MSAPSAGFFVLRLAVLGRYDSPAAVDNFAPTPSTLCPQAGARRLRLCLPALAALALATPAIPQARQSIPITGDRLSGFVLPIEPVQSDIVLAASRARAWTVDDTKRLVLRGDVEISVGGHRLQAEEAVVWINRIPSAQGVINQLAVYFAELRDPAKQSGVGVSGRDLLVTASARGQVTLKAAALDQGTPPQSPLLRAAQQRLAEHLRRLALVPPALAREPQFDPAPRTPEPQPQPGAPLPKPAPGAPVRIELPPTVEESRPWLVSPRGVVHYAADEVHVASGKDENVITIIGALTVEYVPDPQANDETGLTLTAERGVIFTDPAPLREMTGELSAGVVRGLYLEGHVNARSRDDRYALRAPYAYYDFQTQQAITLNSLLRVHARGIKPPVYARAQEMRQLAVNQWSMHTARVSTSEFFTPHVAIGAQDMVVTQRPAADDPAQTETYIEGRGNTLRVEDVPIVGWPRFSGTVEDVPLKSVDVGSRSNDGLRMMTTWDPYTLLGIQRPKGVEADLRLDGFTERGGAAGLAMRYTRGSTRGAFDLYGMFDEGIDRTSSGRDVDPDQEFRGVALLEHQARFSRDWSFQGQASYISDPTFITAWREADFAQRREYETSAYLKHQRDNAAFTALGKAQLNDFLSNDYLLASRQYAVEKLPELTYRRYGDSLFGDTFSYSMENRLTRMRLVLQDTTPGQIGVRGRAFGLGINDPIDEALLARGLRTNFVNRFDSRHELALPLTFGSFNVTPFVVGRFTAYDDEFESFSSDSDGTRIFGAAGIRFNAAWQHIDNSVENLLFDLHRVRHLFEPYVTLWHGVTTISQRDLPEYDPQVESLADGSAIQIGVRNVWQTQRGGPGRWRSVDFLTLDTYFVLDSEGDPDESPTPQFFDYRPEYSQFGEHFRAQGTWLLSDTLAVLGETTVLLGDGTFARSSIGAELRHSPVLSTYIEYRSIQASDTELLAVGWNYQITPKYRVQLSPQWDFRQNEFRSIQLRVTRYFPDFLFSVYVRRDEISNDTSIGATMGLVDF